MSLGFGTEGSGAGQISRNPQGIAVEQESGDVYVSDGANNRIDKFGPEGEFLLAWGWGVADGKTEALQTCTTTCFSGLPGPGAGQLKSAEGIAVDNDPLSSSHGDIYVLDVGNNRVQKFGPQGEFLLMFGAEGAGPGQFERLTGRAIAVDSAGTVYVGDHNRVQRFNDAGVVQSELVFPGAGNIENLAVDSAKDIYLHGKEQAGVHKYDSTGAELGSPRDEGGHGTELAITIGPSDELFVNDFRLPSGPHHIFTYSAEGEQTASFDAGGDAQDARRGIAYSNKAKALYVLNVATVRIVTPPPPGPFVVLGSQTATEIQPTSATLGAMINPEGAATTYHFEYGTTTAYGQSTPVSAPLDAVNEVQSVTVVATGGSFTLAFKGESSGEIPFNATAAEVKAALDGIAALGAGQVAVSGEPGGPWSVEFIGTRAGEDVPQLSADASKLTGPEPSAVVTTTTPGISLFDDRGASAAITGLQPGTTYHFRVVAENAAKEVSAGPDQTFTTLPPVSIDATSASQVNATSARLQAELNPHGLASEYRFEYDTNPYAEGQPGHGIKLPVPDASAGSGTTDTTVEELIQELLPATTYHYRVIAHNALGEVQGPDHSFTTQGASSILPDGRSWELVSPPNKHGSPLEPLTEEGGLIQAAPGGGAFTYVALGPLDTEPAGVRSPTNSQLLASRGAGGWSTSDITTPSEEVTKPHPGVPSEYTFFAEDLHASFVEPSGSTPLSPQTSERTPYRREANGEFVPLVTAANVPAGRKFGSEVQFLTATPDASHVLLASSQVLAAGFGPGFEPALGPNGNTNLYELTAGQLTLVSVLPNGEPAAEAGLAAALGHNKVNMRGAISSDGSRAVFETVSAKGRRELFLRDTSLRQTVRLDEPQPGAVGGVGEVAFQAASSGGTKVFFTDAARLTADATANTSVGQPDLYMCEVKVREGHLSCALTDLSVDPHAGEAANVQGEVSAIDATAAHVYFAANGVLTGAPNARGEHAVAGDCASAGDASCNLYEYDTAAHQLSLVGVLSSKDEPNWGAPRRGSLAYLTARSSPDGRYFTFMSQRSLTGYDNRDAKSAQRDEEVFQLDSTSGKLSCVSCDPSGARPEGVFDKQVFPGLLVDHPSSWGEQWLAGSIPGWTLQQLSLAARYQSRYLSNSGREFFNSADALVPQDTNKVEDVYQYEPPGVGDCSSSSKTYSATSGGCVNLISSGGSKEESAFLDASESGDEVFFLTVSRLSSSDVDGAFDVYDAHVCTSSSPCPPAPPPPSPACQGDACQNPSPPPNDRTPGSLTYQGPANTAPPAPAPVVKAKPPTRAELLAKALKTCKKDKPKRKRLACEKNARKKYGAKKAAKAKQQSKVKKASHGAKGRGHR
jgi:hypothetical protein